MTTDTEMKDMTEVREVETLELLATGREVAPPPAPQLPVAAVIKAAPGTVSALMPRAFLGILAALLLGFAADLLVLGEVRHSRDQQVAYADFREALAKGTAPVSHREPSGTVLPIGTPIALISIPKLGMTEVVRAGTTSGVLRSGPGHRRDSVLPGQVGVSVVMGRQATYGGPFGRIKELVAGDKFTVTTGQGRHNYKVIGPRRAGEPVPAMQVRADGRSASRLTLVTGDGSALMPSGLLRVDADLDTDGPKPSKPKLTPPALLTNKSLPASEKPMGTDSDAWIFIVLWGQALLAASILTAWLLRRWGKWQTWIVAVPVVGAIGLTLADELARLLPNLL